MSAQGVDLRFPPGFYWGAATSSHQVEGNNRNNQWWEWERQSGHIWDGSMSGMACDHYNRFEEDFRLAEEFGHNAHRLSIEWSRIEPEEGRWDEKEVEHYRQVLESLHRHNLTPFVTLHHFTNPLWFERQGGWLNPKSPYMIARYAGHIAKRLGDAVPFWLTINEPQVVVATQYLLGMFPPGHRAPAESMVAARNILIALAKMHQAVKESAPHNPQVGPVMNMTHTMPASDSGYDVAAAQVLDLFWNTYWLDGLRDGVIGPPVRIGGAEPVEGLKDAWDFIGLNYYSRSLVKSGRPLGVRPAPPPPGAEMSTMGWEVYPEGFYQCLVRLKECGKPVYVTENGIGTNDDEQRQSYVVRHLYQVSGAMDEGTDVRGYIHWTLQDNFEWVHGYAQKFGLFAREEGSLNRAPRPSAYMFREIAKANAVPAALVQKHVGSS